MAVFQWITINPVKLLPTTWDFLSYHDVMPKYLPNARVTKVHPKMLVVRTLASSFVDTAINILELADVRIMTDPNSLHASDQVHMGPGITTTRMTNLAVDLQIWPGLIVYC